jgi:hypothetical protein
MTIRKYGRDGREIALSEFQKKLILNCEDRLVKMKLEKFSYPVIKTIGEETITICKEL